MSEKKKGDLKKVTKPNKTKYNSPKKETKKPAVVQKIETPKKAFIVPIKKEQPKEVSKDKKSVNPTLGEYVLFCKHPDRPYQLALVTSVDNDNDCASLHVFTPHGIDVRKSIPYSKEPKLRTWKNK